MLKKPSNIVVLVLLLGMIGLVWWMSQNPAESDEETASDLPTSAPPTILFDLADDAEFEQVTITDYENNNAVSLVRSGEVDWLISLAGGEPAPADPIQVFSLTGMMRSIYVQQTIDGEDGVRRFGVLDPGYTIEIALTDGKQISAAVGDELFDGSAFYVQVDGETDVQVVNRQSIDNILVILTEPPVMLPTEEPLLPDVTPES